MQCIKYTATDLWKSIFMQGRQHPVQVLYTRNAVSNYLEATADAVLQVHYTEPPGDVLVFLPGQEEIESVQRSLLFRYWWGGVQSSCEHCSRL